MPDTIAFVAPRYGLEFVGGAEGILRELAEALQRTGIPVEVLTTCSNDLVTWNNFYQPGVTMVNNVVVRRFRTDTVDQAAYNRVAVKAFTVPERLPYREQQIYIRNSINSQELYNYLREHAARYRCCITGPYLFGTTYHTAQIMRDKTIHLPCLHDECFAYFDIFREMLEEARGILFNSPEEAALARKLGITNPAAAVVGCGFEQPDRGDPGRFHAQHKLDDAPFLLYSGRYELTKNVPLLIDYFRRYKQEHDVPPRLALAGRGTIPIPAHPDIVDLGFFRPGTMEDVLASALALVQLSVAESFSLVLMESWLHARPAIVHRDCAVTRGHVERSGGGWVAGSYEEFAAAVDGMIADRAEADRRGVAGKRYVTSEYSWDTVLSKFHMAINAFMEPPALYQVLGQRGRRRALDFSIERYEDHFRELVDLAVGHLDDTNSPAAQAKQIEQLATITQPDYRVESRLPLVGRLIAWGRTQLTAHLREPYLDPILERQERFNRALQSQVARLAHVVAQREHRPDRVKLRQQQAQIVMLQRRVARLEAQLAGREQASPSRNGADTPAEVVEAE